MNFAALEKVANAVLYEGYLLYPYRKSAVKNRYRWHFGTLAPGGGEGSRMQTQCLVSGDERTAVTIKIRFLQDEEEREILLDEVRLNSAPERVEFAFSPIRGEVEVVSQPVTRDAFRLSVSIVNLTPDDDEEKSKRPMLSTHTLLGVIAGAFVSQLDPPEGLKSAAAECWNIGSWPVLGGAEGEHDLMLSSPIILYDYPQVAPESSGDFFDSTEIDEMLTLRVLTLTEDEKQEMRSGDERARAVLERTEGLPPEHMARLHGAVRSLRNASRLAFQAGDRVRLRPRKRADIFDIALDGKTAIVESIERDFEDRIHVAVTVEDDPGSDLGVDRQIGHRFFFTADEVELL
jgi:hypothetical protein